MLERFLSIVLLTVFLLINLIMLVVRPLVSAGTRLWRWVFRVELPKDEKRGYGWLYTIVWAVVGAWGAWELKEAGVLAGFFGFLAFRSGANVTRTLVYGLHDQGILKDYSGEGLLSIIGDLMKFSLLMEILFMASLALIYKTLSVTAGPRMSAGGFVLYLWTAGLVFGLVFGWLMARNNRGVLLQNTVPVVLFFSARAGKNRTEEMVGRIKTGPQSLSSRLKRFK